MCFKRKFLFKCVDVKSSIFSVNMAYIERTIYSLFPVTIYSLLFLHPSLSLKSPKISLTPHFWSVLMAAESRLYGFALTSKHMSKDT